MTWSIRTRLTVWYGVSMALSLTLFSLSVLWLHGRWGRANFDAELTTIAAALSRVMHEEVGETGNLKSAALEARQSMAVADRATAILGRQGEVIDAHWEGFSYDAAVVGTGTPSASRFITVGTSPHAWRVLLRPDRTFAGEYVVLVGGTLDELALQQHLLSRVLLVATPLLVILTSGLSWSVASRALRPVTIMAGQTKTITAQSAGWRLDTPASTDELGQLARAFNQLLGRLEAASSLQRQFMADASHELRTPVSVIQTAAEVTLQRKARQEWEYREALTIVLEQGGRLRRMVEDMLVLARADAGGHRPIKRPLDLDEILTDCVRAASLVAAVRGIRIATTTGPDLSVDADAELIRRLLMNLLDNALQYTPAGGSVAVIAGRDGDAVTVDPARSATSGAGLGLPIARWIAEQHEGRLTVEQNPGGGCRFVVRIPLNKPSDTGLADRGSRTGHTALLNMNGR
jgi:signal transduction histidine kinase